VHIVLTDDVLTTGSHFKGAAMVLQQRYPGVTIVGLFLARAIRPDVVLELIDDITL
jgi:predicted amidophosphoribosyltransferase